MNTTLRCRVCGAEAPVSRAALAARGHPACVYRRSLVAAATGGLDALALRVWRLRQTLRRAEGRRRGGAR